MDHFRPSNSSLRARYAIIAVKQLARACGLLNLRGAKRAPLMGALLALLLASCFDKKETDSGLAEQGASDSSLSGAGSNTGSFGERTADSASRNCFAVYVDRYPDLLSAYTANSAGLTKADWGDRHYSMFGSKEGRALPSGCQGLIASASTIPGYSYPDYRLVYQLNAAFTGGNVVRWKSRNVGLQNFEATYIRDGVKPWTGFNFTTSDSGIVFKGSSDKFSDSCGWAVPYWYQNYELARCDIWINIATHVQGQCGSITSTITHEVGHCLGILAHTSDGGLMDATASGSTTISNGVKRMLDVLYATPLNSRVTASGVVSVGKELIDRGAIVKGETIFVMPQDKRVID